MNQPYLESTLLIKGGSTPKIYLQFNYNQLPSQKFG